METPFTKEAELKEKSERLKELNILLNMDQKDRTLLDEGKEEETPIKEKNRKLNEERRNKFKKFFFRNNIPSSFCGRKNIWIGVTH